MNNICASIISLKLLSEGFGASIPGIGSNIINMGPITLPARLAEQFIRIVIELPIQLMIEEFNIFLIG